MSTEISFPPRPYFRELIDRILELYSEMDRQTAIFRKSTGLECPDGCGECCEHSRPETTVIELLPSAEEIFSRKEETKWLEEIASAGETGRCVFFKPDPLIPGNGRCHFYRFRPSICRLFPYAAIKDKDGRPKMLICRRQKKEMPSLIKKAQEAILRGMPFPNLDHFLLQIFTLDPFIGRQKVPINQAIRIAIERYGLWIQFLKDG